MEGVMTDRQGYPSAAVARIFLYLAWSESNELSHLQVMKMTYMAHGFFLAIVRRPLVSDPVEVWQYGPVFPNLHEKMTECGAGPMQIVSSIPAESGEMDGSLASDEDQMELITAVYHRYKQYGGAALAAMTHRPETPWNKVVDDFARGVRITNDSIQRHYSSMIEQQAA